MCTQGLVLLAVLLGRLGGGCELLPRWNDVGEGYGYR